MRLLNTSSFDLRSFEDNEAPPYAILSHTWDKEEITLQDLKKTDAANRQGYEKVRSFCYKARANGFNYVWMDTCCIDKTSSAELSEAINSMYRWYQEAEVRYAYLADVPSKKCFAESRWFTRGWTLQELIAPATVIFFNGEWNSVGTKETLQQDISSCTGIPANILSGDEGLEMYSIAQKMAWAAKRQTSKIEDRAYCLLGIFDINMPLIYGERENAFIRLQEEIMKVSDDHTIFAWRHPDNRGGLLATSPASFASSHDVVQYNPFGVSNRPPTVSSRGMHLELRFVGRGYPGLGLAILPCKENHVGDEPIAIYVRDLELTMERFQRVETEKFELFDLKRYRPSQYPFRRMCIQIGRTTRMRKSNELGNYENIPLKLYTHSELTRLMNYEEPEALTHAAQEGLEEVVWLLLTRDDIKIDLKDKHGRTALTHAVQKGKKVVVKMLLAQKDVDIESSDNNGRTPLWWAVDSKDEAVIKLLLEKGANVEAKDNCDWKPLLWAAHNGHDVGAKLLIDKGAGIEVKDKYGQTPLSVAASLGHETLVQLLVDSGANCEAKDRCGRTPLLWAACNGHEAIVKQLVEGGADLEARCLQQPTHTNIRKSNLLSKARTKARLKYGRTPLSWAASEGHEAVVKLLLDKGASREAKDEYRLTPLLWAVKEGRAEVVRLLELYSSTA